MADQSAFELSPRTWLTEQGARVRQILLARALLRAWPEMVSTGDNSSHFRALLFLIFRATALIYIKAAHGMNRAEFPSAQLAAEIHQVTAALRSLPRVEKKLLAQITCAEAAAHALAADEDPPSAYLAIALLGRFTRYGGVVRLRGTHLPIPGQTVIDADQVLKDDYLLFRPLFTPRRGIADTSFPQLALLGSTWRVWFDWYEKRLKGTRDRAELDFAYLTDMQPRYGAQPELLNNLIRESLNALTTVPGRTLDEPPSPNDVEQQETTSINFSLTFDNRVDIDAEAGADHIQGSPLHQELHSELVDAARTLSNVCAQSNLTAELLHITSRFSQSIGASPLEVRPGLAVSRGNLLRNELEKDIEREKAKDPDRPRMSEQSRAALRQLVDVWNMYVGSDAFLESIDRNRLGPDAAEQEGISQRSIGYAISSAEAADIATIDAIEALRELESVTQSSTIAASRTFAFQLTALRNFSRVVIRAALISFKVACTVVPPLIWVSQNMEFLRSILAAHPSMISILDWLAAQAAKFF